VHSQSVDENDNCVKSSAQRPEKAARQSADENDNCEISGTCVSDDFTAVSAISANLMFLIYTLGMHPFQVSSSVRESVK